MNVGQTTATRTYLELTDRGALRPSGVPDGDVRVERREQCDPEFWRHLYSTVGEAYHWIDRLPWTDEEIRAYLADPAVSLWVLTVGGTVAGYFELRSDAATTASSVEIAYFGLFPEFIGRGLGGYLLTEAVESAWAAGAHRVWLHTCSFDHRFAIKNYLDRGFTVSKPSSTSPFIRDRQARDADLADPRAYSAIQSGRTCPASTSNDRLAQSA